MQCFRRQWKKRYSKIQNTMNILTSAFHIFWQIKKYQTHAQIRNTCTNTVLVCYLTNYFTLGGCPPWKNRIFCRLFPFPFPFPLQEIAIKPPHLAFSMANTWQDIHIKICRLLHSLGCNSHYIPLCTAVLQPARILLLTLNTPSKVLMSCACHDVPLTTYRTVIHVKFWHQYKK